MTSIPAFETDSSPTQFIPPHNLHFHSNLLILLPPPWGLNTVHDPFSFLTFLVLSTLVFPHSFFYEILYPSFQFALVPALHRTTLRSWIWSYLLLIFQMQPFKEPHWFEPFVSHEICCKSQKFQKFCHIFQHGHFSLSHKQKLILLHSSQGRGKKFILELFHKLCPIEVRLLWNFFGGIPDNLPLPTPWTYGLPNPHT